MSSRPSRGAARLAAILDALPDGLLLVNCNGTVVNANTVALEMLEAPGTGLVGRGVLDLLPSFDSRLIPGSMRRPESEDDQGRTKPTRMVARRTDGTEFPVEVTSANLEDGRDAYASYGSGGGPGSYSGDELLMLVVRDLSGTVDTEAELARSQRQTEMILRAAAEGVVGTDTDGRVVLVNPAAAQILGYRASDLGGQELHPLVLHSREDGEPFPYEGSPLADTLKSGRKHRVRGQVIWTKSGAKVPVDLTTAPVRDGDLLVGAVMTFTDRRPYEEQAAKHAEVLERETKRYDALAARHQQLLSVLGGSLRGPIDELRQELAALAADDAGQLWPEANQVLHHLAAGYSRITTLVDNVLGYQRLDAGGEELKKTKVPVDSVVGAGVDGAVELIGPGRAQFAVHTPPIEAEVDAPRLSTALAHLIADVAGVDATGKAPVALGGYMDSTVVVAAAVRGEVVRIEVRGPYAGGDPVHAPIVRGIVKAHGGVLQTVDVPGMSGSAYVLEVPLGAGAGTVEAPVAPRPDEALLPAQQDGGGRRRGRRASMDAFLESPVTEEKSPTGRRRARAESGPGSGSGSGAGEGDGGPDGDRARIPAQQHIGDGENGGAPGSVPGADAPAVGAASGSGRRRGRPSPAEQAAALALPQGGGGGQASEGSVVTGAESARESSGMGRAALGETVPPQGVPTEATGRRARRALPAPGGAEGPTALGQGTGGQGATGQGAGGSSSAPSSASAPSSHPASGSGSGSGEGAGEPTGRRARRALGSAPAGATGSAQGQEAGSVRTAFALPPADADRAPHPAPPAFTTADAPAPGHHDSVRPVGARAMGAGHMGSGPGTNTDAAGRASAGTPGAAAVSPGGAPAGADPRAAGVGPAPRTPSGTPMGAGPAAAGPAAVGSVPVGTAEAGAVGAGPMGAGAVGAGPMGAGPTGAGPTGVDPASAGPMGAPPTGGAPTGVTPTGVEPTGTARPMGAQPMGAQPMGAQPTGARPMGAQPTGPVSMGKAPARPAPAGPTPDGAPLNPASRPAASGTGPGTNPAAANPVGAAPMGPAPTGPAHTGPAPTGLTPAGPTPVGPAGTSPTPGGSPVMAGSSPAERTPAAGPAAGGRTRTRTAAPGHPAPGDPLDEHTPPQPHPAEQPEWAARAVTGAAGPVPPQGQAPRPTRQPLPAETPPGGIPIVAGDTQGRAFSVRALGQGTPFAQAQAAQAQAQAPAPAHPTQAGQPSGRRRKLGTPPEGVERPADAPARPQPVLPSPPSEGQGRAYAIGAPDEGAEGPEPLDGPGGAVEVANRPQPQPVDDELPPEPLDNPRRLLVWPAPDVSTQQALSDRGYRPVVVHSREEVDAQIAAFPAALFVDPLTGPITRTALQSLRQAAVAAEVPVLVTAGLGQATREAAYGADPAVLLKALAPRDSEQHPSRVLLIEEHEEIALALTATLERRGMQVARAATDSEAVTLAAQMRPNLVVMDLMQVRRRRAGIVDWLRANGQLNHTPLVVYTSAGIDRAELPKLTSGETVLFLAERSTSGEVQGRIVDLLAKIGTN
ncbi:PAS domain-containing protein [Streptomyces sp. NBC_00083]|uniref:PAS domain-containing protein n=1 Tax=Streptomyces sp. NBC_00083 TaxID=2975647 RepID=UPI002259A65D|nr:PAS domain-containing protein [Streptomyces sp. NBC_00083]MCX5387671.1 PAS domain-containing protein [Streptomyces sp. NBC_00083]